jgi:F0F1-type ATP synthase assembly protein I
MVPPEVHKVVNDYPLTVGYLSTLVLAAVMLLILGGL